MKYVQITSLLMIGILFEIPNLNAQEAKIAREATANWPFYRGTQRLDGQASGSLTLPLKKLWVVDTKDAVVSSPVIFNGTVYIASNDGYLRAIELSSGKLLWKRDLRYATDEEEKKAAEDPESISARLKAEGAPLYHNGRVYVGSSNGYMHAFDAKDGKRIWAFETYGEIASSPMVAKIKDKEHLLIGSHDNFLYCIDMDGKERWQYETDNYVNATPAIVTLNGKQLAVFGGCDGIIHCVDLDKGKAARTIELGAYMSGSASANAGWIYTGNHGNEVLAFNLANKSDDPAWKYKEKNFPFFGSPAINSNKLLIGSRDKKLHCMNLKTGEKIWQARTRGRIDSSPIIVSDKVIVGSDDGRLYVFALKDGKRLFDFDTGGKIPGSPAFVNGYVVIGNDAGKIFCLKASSN